MSLASGEKIAPCESVGVSSFSSPNTWTLKLVGAGQLPSVAIAPSLTSLKSWLLASSALRPSVVEIIGLGFAAVNVISPLVLLAKLGSEVEEVTLAVLLIIAASATLQLSVATSVTVNELPDGSEVTDTLRLFP